MRKLNYSFMIFLLTIVLVVPSVAQAGVSHDLEALEQGVNELEDLLMNVTRNNNDIFFDGVNVHVRNGLGETDGVVGPFEDGTAVNGLGNLIIGYDEGVPSDKTGSHNLVIGPQHSYPSFGGLVAGSGNTISGKYSSVTAGNNNEASGLFSSVSGGIQNEASGTRASVSGGRKNLASGGRASVSGGENNTASGLSSSVSGGGATDPDSPVGGNTASGIASSVVGGEGNTADDSFSTVLGGIGNSTTSSHDVTP